MAKKLKIRMEPEMLERIRRVARAGGYSSEQEFVMHVLERELEQLDPGDGESEEEIRRKMEGLGYIS
jgi:Arc/MetJ-type ribon-helix-helix transcriptional regulator